MEEPVAERSAADRERRAERVTVLVVYVLPVALATALLAAAGLVGLALALLAVEAVVGVAVVLAKRRPARAPGEPSPRAWLVPVAMVGLLGLLVLGAVVAASYG